MKKINGLDCILLVDDDDATNFLHQRVIKKMNWDVHVQVAMNGLEALDFLTKAGKYENSELPQPGMIFLDINMPGMNGWEFMEKYKALPEEQKAKIVIAMITASLNPDDQKKAGLYKQDLKMFLNKPLSVVNLEELINKFYTANE